MTQYNVTGMSCAACVARVERAVNAVSGVNSCSVSLLTNSMGVEGTADPKEIISAVEKAGYGASLKTSKKSSSKTENDDTLKDTETPKLKKRLIASVGFLVVLMYISMGHVMWGWRLPEFLATNPLAIGLLQLLLTTIIMVINQKFFINGFKGLLHKSPNMDTLVALGAGASYIYSTYILFKMTANVQVPHYFLHEFYFESAAMILTLITVGKMLESHSKGKTTDALKSLMKLAPETANIIVDGVETEVPVTEVFEGYGYSAHIFNGESAEPQKVRERINKEIERVMKTGVDRETFERIKKKHYGSLIMDFDNIDSISNSLISAYFNGEGLYDQLKTLESITPEDIDRRLRDSINIENSSMSVIK